MDMLPAPMVEHVYVVNTKKSDVRAAYGRVAKANKEKKNCGVGSSCCGVNQNMDASYYIKLGYSEEDLASAPKESNMGLGCGNPQAIALLKEGEIVLDLGSGGGFDAFLAAKKVGKKGFVYGVDMTPDMLELSRDLVKKEGVKNLSFLLGEIEHLPLPNETVDVILSNCVINLSNDKEQVFKEAFRVLKKGGRLAISDIVAEKPLPKQMQENSDLHCNCISGALPIKELKDILARQGFQNISITLDPGSKQFISDWVPGSDAENFVISAKIEAKKP